MLKQEDTQIKLTEIEEFVKECKQELKDCRIHKAKLQSQLDQELNEERNLLSRLERLLLQKQFLSGFLEGLTYVEGN